MDKLSKDNNWFLNISDKKYSKKTLKPPLFLTEHIEYLKYMTKEDRYENSRGFNEFYIYQIEVNPKAKIFGLQNNPEEDDLELLEEYLSRIRQLKFKSHWGNGWKMYTKEEILEILRKENPYYITEADFMKKFYKKYNYDGFITEEYAGYEKPFENLCILNIDIIDSVEKVPIDDPEDEFRLDPRLKEEKIKLQEIEKNKIPQDLLSWISPSGKIYNFERPDCHFVFILQNLPLFGFKDKEDFNKFYETSEESLLDYVILRKGWIRVLTQKNRILFDVKDLKSSSKNRIVDYILKFMDKYDIGLDTKIGIDKRIDDDNSDFFELTIEDLFNDELDSRLRESKLKEIYTPSTLWIISPNGESYKVNDEYHEEFIENHPELFNFTKEESRRTRPVELAMNKGWIRVRCFEGVLGFSVNNFSYKHRKLISDWIMENESELANKRISFVDITSKGDVIKSFPWSQRWDRLQEKTFGKILQEIVTQDYARELAKKAHDDENQKRRGTKKPYWTHTQTVADIVDAFDGSKDQIIAAELHDTQEDTKLLLDVIEDDNDNGNKISNLVMELTNNDNLVKKLGKENYMNDHLVNMSNDALLIKLADFYHNFSDNPGEDQRKRMIKNIKFLIKNRKLDKKCRRIMRSIVSFIKMRGWV